MRAMCSNTTAHVTSSASVKLAARCRHAWVASSCSLMTNLRPFERIHHQSPFVEELLYFGFFRFACLFFLFFIHRLGDQQLLNRERGIKWLVVVIQIEHARTK